MCASKRSACPVLRMQDDRIHARTTDGATATHAGKQLRKEQQQQGASANACSPGSHLGEDAPYLRVIEPAAGTSTHGHATRIVALLLPERRARRLLGGSSSDASARALLPLLRLDQHGPVAMWAGPLMEQAPCTASGSTPSTAGRETRTASNASAGTAAPLAKQSPGHQSLASAAQPQTSAVDTAEAVGTTIPSVWLLVISLTLDTTPQSNGPASQASALGTSGYPPVNSAPTIDGSSGIKGQPMQPATAAAALTVLMRSSPASLSAALALSQPWGEGSSRQVTLSDAEATACMQAVSTAETTIPNGGHAAHLSGEIWEIWETWKTWETWE